MLAVDVSVCLPYAQVCTDEVADDSRDGGPPDSCSVHEDQHEGDAYQRSPAAGVLPGETLKVGR